MCVILPEAVFIHVPRTGGIWLRTVLRTVVPGIMELRGDDRHHMPLSALPDCLQRLPSFGFVRHPLRWAYSRWEHSRRIRGLEDKRFYGLHRRFDELVRDSFSETIRELIRCRPGLVSQTFAWMLEGVRVYRFEDLPDAGADALMRFADLGVTTALEAVATPRENACEIPPHQREKLPESLEADFLASEENIVKGYYQ